MDQASWHRLKARAGARDALGSVRDPLQGIGSIMISWRLPRRHQRIHESLIPRSEAISQRPDVLLPLRLGARPGDVRGNRPVQDSPRVP